MRGPPTEPAIFRRSASPGTARGADAQNAQPETHRSFGVRLRPAPGNRRLPHRELGGVAEWWLGSVDRAGSFAGKRRPAAIMSAGVVFVVWPATGWGSRRATGVRRVERVLRLPLLATHRWIGGSIKVVQPATHGVDDRLL